jgi:hypothetical protein
MVPSEDGCKRGTLNRMFAPLRFLALLGPSIHSCALRFDNPQTEAGGGLGLMNIFVRRTLIDCRANARASRPAHHDVR